MKDLRAQLSSILSRGFSKIVLEVKSCFIHCKTISANFLAAVYLIYARKEGEQKKFMFLTEIDLRKGIEPMSENVVDDPDFDTYLQAFACLLVASA